MNPGASGLLVDDLEAVVAAGLDGIVLPKTESAADVSAVDALLGVLERSRGLEPGSVALIATIETAVGLGRVRRDRRRQSPDRLPRIRRAATSASTSGSTGRRTAGLGHTLLSAKAELVLASRRNGLGAPHDGVFPDFRALHHLRAEARAARALGFAGKHAIHPDQLAVITEVFSPSAGQLAEAEAVVQAYEAGIRDGRGGVHIDGRFIDAPVAARARRVLADRPNGDAGAGPAPSPRLRQRPPRPRHRRRRSR